MPAVSAKVAEYVDSPKLYRRLKIGTILSCSIKGNYGTYKTHAHTHIKQRSECTCPSESSPCKHVAALRETYRVKPRSFADIDKVVKRLENKSKEQLIVLIREMALIAPPTLAVLGVKGLKDPDESEDSYDE